MSTVWTSVDGITWSLVAHHEAVFGGENLQSMLSVTAGGPGVVAVGHNWSDEDSSGNAAVWVAAPEN